MKLQAWMEEVGERDREGGRERSGYKAVLLKNWETGMK